MTTNSKKTITQKQDSTTTLSLPDGVPSLRAFYLYMTTGCNLQCRHCWITPTFVRGVPSPGDCLSPELLNSAIDEALPLGLQSIKLTGGEPMMHPKFREIAKLITDRELRMDMETNGTLMTAEAAHFIKEETNLNFVSVSLDSVDAKKHDHFRGVKGAFDAAVKGIENLVSVGFRPQVIMSPHRGNIDEIDAMVEFATKLGAGSVKFNPVSCIGRGEDMHKKGEALVQSEVLNLIRYINEDLVLRSSIRLHIGAPMALLSIDDILHDRWRGVCNVIHILGILGTGHMAMCGIGRNIPELCYGELGKDSLKEIWETHPTLKKIRTDLTGEFPGICKECIHARGCRTGCLAMNFSASGNLLHPSPLCQYAVDHNIFPETRKKTWSPETKDSA